MKFLSCIVFSIFIGFLDLSGQAIPELLHYQIEQVATGDLDSDGTEEKAVVYLSDSIENDFENKPRLLVIYKLKKLKWYQWYTSDEVILGSRDGGVMGDPFVGIDIKNGVLITDHYGGSSWKWAYTEKYRFQQNDFYLIGYTEEYGKHGFEWRTFDFNLSTGKILFTKLYNDETVDSYLTEDYAREIRETFYKKNVKITLKNRNHYKLKIVSPKYKETLSL